jgi:hypothetical protein
MPSHHMQPKCPSGVHIQMQSTLDMPDMPMEPHGEPHNVLMHGPPSAPNERANLGSTSPTLCTLLSVKLREVPQPIIQVVQVVNLQQHKLKKARSECPLALASAHPGTSLYALSTDRMKRFRAHCHELPLRRWSNHIIMPQQTSPLTNTSPPHAS